MFSFVKKFFKEYIKIKNKNSYDELDYKEIAKMIKADSSLDNGNEYFDSMALDDFLYIDVQREDLKKLQKYILKNIYLKKDNKILINKDFLLNLARKLENCEKIDDCLE